MFGLQPTHLVIILVVALLIFGPNRLPELGRALGKTIKEIQDVTKGTPDRPAELEKPTNQEKKAPPKV
ncbi:MAG: twin-arginine translocase TatA/TatE family subunit [Chloroflexi bacterium]|nr:twin-arginine translocase TatA/TatE family subunit [Chloroflexota bacterium]